MREQPASISNVILAGIGACIIIFIVLIGVHLARTLS